MLSLPIGKLYIVATPIGNLEDLTFRAVRILKEVDFIFCEDTRTSKTLLDAYNIQTKTLSYHTHSSISKETSIINFLEEGKNIALISDAGTPGISDPGSHLINTVQNHFKDENNIIPIPGPSAFSAAFSVAGISGNEFAFLGFVPHKKGRETFFNLLGTYNFPIGFYESKHRIDKTLSSLETRYENSHTLFLAREMTKKFEEYKKDSISTIKEYIENNTDSQKGEFVLILIPKKGKI